jgi:hypothetical protein
MARRTSVFYRPIKDARNFGPRRLYSDVNWNSFSESVRFFRGQLLAWYICPAKVLRRRSVHFGFAHLALSCLLLDALCQYYYGKSEAGAKDYKRFVRKHFNGAARRFAVPIEITSRGKKKKLKCFADVLYHGVRCGILHEAHTKLYCGLCALPANVWAYQRSGHTLWSRKNHGFRDCPSVILDPGRFLNRVCEIFDGYMADLLNPANTKLRKRFKKRFRIAFGIAIEQEPA